MNKELAQKLAYKTQMPRHLEQLSEIAGRAVSQDELLSVDQTNILHAKCKKFSGIGKSSFEVKLTDIQSKGFTRFIEDLKIANPKPVFIGTELTAACGALELQSVASINLGFSPKTIGEGIFSVATQDLENRLLFDFDEDSAVIELQGPDWEGIEALV